MTPKRFSQVFLVASAVFVAINGLTWIFATEALLSRSDGVVTGDLSRLGYIDDILHPRLNTYSLPRRHLEPSDYQGQPLQLLTIGDSFSNGGAGGPDRYYQDFIATQMGWQVLNLTLHPDTRSDIETLFMLANAGELQRMRVRYVLLQTTQRKAIERLTFPVREDFRLTPKQIREYYRFGTRENAKKVLALPDTRFINTGNFKYWWNKLMYRVHDCALNSLTCRTRLNKSRFSTQVGDHLLFYRKDLNAISKHTPESIVMANRQLNALAEALSKIGIELIFLPVVTKYDLYRDDFIDDSYPQDPFFKLLREQPKQYLFVDSKKVLRMAVEGGELDIYYADDTHWGPKAASLITGEIERLIDH